ncbi:MAG: hypothetical protein ABJB74_10585 [Gemmatimonas sp.]
MLFFAFFTKRSHEISTRLRLVARGFQFSGIFVWTVVAFGTVALPFIKQPVRMYRWMFAPTLLYGALVGASMFLIGRALMRRQRWGAYLAGVTLGVPLLRQFVMPNAAILSIPEIIYTTLALGAIVTVWDELGSERDAEFSQSDDDDDHELPIRNRGFGEPRTLPLQSVSELSASHFASLTEHEPVTVDRRS